MKKERLDKYLHDLGYGTRSEIKIFIKKNNIYINDILIKDSGYLIDPSIDKLMINDQIINYQKYIYLMLNKPAGYISTTEDLPNSVMKLLKDYKKYQIFPIGRLDKDTTGLLLFTNDGMFSHNLIHPKKHIDKIYNVMVDKKLDENKIKEVMKGINQPNFKTKPCIIKIIDDYNYEFIIHEGQYHQIKRMVNYLDSNVIKLHRLAVGNLYLDIDEGMVRELNDSEILKLKKE